jgi:hypothetical protein
MPYGESTPNWPIALHRPRVPRPLPREFPQNVRPTLRMPLESVAGTKSR